MNENSDRTFGLPIHGWLGVATLTLGETGLLLQISWIATWFTPIMWTGFILLGSGLLQRWRGRSWFSSHWKELPLIALLSILVWLLFEAYNLHLVNWIYQGLPASAFWRDLGYFWSFATIMPGVFITYLLLDAMLPQADGQDTSQISGWDHCIQGVWFLLGLLLVILPLLFSTEVASYLFALVWIGYIFLLDPVNELLGEPSIRRQWQYGRLRPTAIWLMAGMVCGLLWETWNFQAFMAEGAYWIYTVPTGLRLTGLQFGQMPLLGLLGFPPFALELRAFYLFLRKVLGGKRVFGETLISE
ncbi:MAG: hypothetical protein ACLFWD_02570 [Anaerolineales bacterium]